MPETIISDLRFFMISFRTRYIIFICISVLVLQVATLHAQDWGVIKCADCTVNVRSERSEDSVIVLQLNPGDLAKVEFLEGSW